MFSFIFSSIITPVPPCKVEGQEAEAFWVVATLALAQPSFTSVGISSLNTGLSSSLHDSWQIVSGSYQNIFSLACAVLFAGLSVGLPVSGEYSCPHKSS